MTGRRPGPDDVLATAAAYGSARLPCTRAELLESGVWLDRSHARLAAGSGARGPHRRLPERGTPLDPAELEDQERLTGAWTEVPEEQRPGAMWLPAAPELSEMMLGGHGKTGIRDAGEPIRIWHDTEFLYAAWDTARNPERVSRCGAPDGAFWEDDCDRGAWLLPYRRRAAQPKDRWRARVDSGACARRRPDHRRVHRAPGLASSSRLPSSGGASPGHAARAGLHPSTETGWGVNHYINHQRWTATKGVGL